MAPVHMTYAGKFMPAHFMISLVSFPTQQAIPKRNLPLDDVLIRLLSQPYILTFPISVRCKMLMGSLGRLTAIVLSFRHSPSFMRLCNMAYICSDSHVRTRFVIEDSDLSSANYRQTRIYDMYKEESTFVLCIRTPKSSIATND